MRKTETISLFLDAELKRRLVEAAAKEERSLSDFVRRLCKQYIEALEVER
jgi:uncharacterized protein (DUF1778 family)